MSPEQQATALAWETICKGATAFRVLAMGRELHLTLDGPAMLTIWNDTLKQAVAKNETVLNEIKETTCAR